MSLNKLVSRVFIERVSPDSMIDVNKTILEQFNLFRIVDNERYSAYFDFLGKPLT